MRVKLSSTVKLNPVPGLKPVAGESANYSFLCDGSSTERRRTRGNFAFPPYLTAWKGVKSQRNEPDFDSLTVKFAGESSTGNLYTRFDEGRGGLAFRLAPSSTLLVNFQILILLNPLRILRYLWLIQWLRP